MIKLLFLLGFCFFWPTMIRVVIGQQDDLQTEFYLPYSETEDVDFNIQRPTGLGCYQWSTDSPDLVNLQPVLTNYELQCGNKLEFTVAPKSPQPEKDIKIIAENVDLSADYNSNDVPAMIEYTLHVRPVAKLELMGLKTELTVGSASAPFGVTGYDKEDNEFDTMDGVQVSWFVGGKRDVASFEPYQTSGPIAKLIPTSAGKGNIIAILNDPNYKDLEPAVLEITVKSNIEIVPDGVFMLEGAIVPLKLMESFRKNNKDETREIDLSGEQPLYTFSIKDESIVSIKDRTLVGVREGETTVFVKNEDGEVVKSSPVRVTKVHSIKVNSYPHPESKKLVEYQDYEIRVDLYDKNERSIYPSENILSKTWFPPQLAVLQMSSNGLSATVRPIRNGPAKVKASLRSVLAEDDEELEIIPHLKATGEFEVFEKVSVKPKRYILPYDASNATANLMSIRLSASGGTEKQYSWSVDSEDHASVDSEGLLSFHSGPGSVKVKAAMVHNELNYDEADVFMYPPSGLSFEYETFEVPVANTAHIAIKAFAFVPDRTEPEDITECSNLKYLIELSNTEDFEVIRRTDEFDMKHYKSCAAIHITAKAPGKTGTITISYFESTTQLFLTAKARLQSYSELKLVSPRLSLQNRVIGMVEMNLPVGSHQKALFSGGPWPFHENTENYFKQIEIEDPEVVKTEQIDSGDLDLHLYQVTCMEKGSSEVALSIGSRISEEHKNPILSKVTFKVNCKVPAKLTMTTKYLTEEEGKLLVVNHSNGRVMANNKKDLMLALTVKDEQGQTFDSVNSLKFDFQLSQPDILKPKGDLQTTETTIPGTNIRMNQKPFQVFSPQGKVGEVDIRVKLSGYDEAVLKAEGIESPAPLPKVVDDEDEDSEDDAMFDQHHHNLQDTVELLLSTDDQILKYK